MHKTHQSILILFSVFTFSVMAMLDVGYAQPVIKLEVDPDRQTISIGADIEDIFIEAQADKPSGYQFRWHLDGPGQLAGDTTSPGIVYIPPKSIDEASAQATISVIVTNNNGDQTAESVTFTLIAPTPTPSPTATPIPPPTLPPKIRIRDVIITSEKGYRIYEVENRYYLLKPGERIIMKHIEVEGVPDDIDFQVELEAEQGQVGSEISYTALKKPGVIDPLTIDLVEKTTGQVLAQKAIIIKTQSGTER